jgi:hypothetical protein
VKDTVKSARAQMNGRTHKITEKFPNLNIYFLQNRQPSGKFSKLKKIHKGILVLNSEGKGSRFGISSGIAFCLRDTSLFYNLRILYPGFPFAPHLRHSCTQTHK